MVMVWVAGIPWSQEAKTYWVLPPTICVPAAMEWVVPGVHYMRQGEGQAALSTVKVRSAGTDCMVVVGTAWKVAVRVAGAVRVRVWGVVAPVRGPLKAVN